MSLIDDFDVETLPADAISFDTFPVCRRRIQPHVMGVRNGKIPTARFQQEMAITLNQVARYRTKEYARFGGGVTAPVDDVLWRFAGGIGPMAGVMIAEIVMAPATQTSQTSNPNIAFAIHDQNGNQLAQARGHFGYSHGVTPLETPDEWGVATVAVDVSAFRGTKFRAVLRADEEARPISATIYEYSLSPNNAYGYVDQSYSVLAPIIDTDRSGLATLAHEIYKHGGPSLFSFSSRTDATAPTTVATSYANIWDPAAIGLVAQVHDVPAIELDLRFCNRVTKTTVPVVFECYAGTTAATAGTVRVRDEAGNVYATFAVGTLGGSVPAGWQTPVAANLPADVRRYIVEFKADGGGGTVTVNAVNCYRWVD